MPSTQIETASKTVQVEEPSYGSLAGAVNTVVEKHIKEGWTLFAINTVNHNSYNGTGCPFALVTFVR